MSSRGQSLVEFALVLPVLLLITLMGLDFGRAFLAVVEVNNAVRVAANFAATHPNAWDTANPDADEQAQYQALIANEWAGIDCDRPRSASDPTFPSGSGIGQPAKVTLSCQFHPLTPLIERILGNTVSVTRTAAFPIRSGSIANIPVTTVPTPAPTASPTPSPSPTASASPSPTPGPGTTPIPTSSPTAAPTATPEPVCIVPKLVDLHPNEVGATWAASGFTQPVVFDPLAQGNARIRTQSLPVGSSKPCRSTVITVSQ